MEAIHSPYLLYLLPPLIILITYLYCSYKLNYWRRRGVTQLKNTSMIFGDFKNAALFRTGPGSHLGQLYRDAPADAPYIGFYIFHKPCLLLRDPQIIKQVMISDFANFSNRHFAGNQQKDSIGMVNLFGLKDPAWGYLRRKISPTLARGKLRQMLPLMTDTGKPMVDYLNKITQGKEPKAIDVQDVSYKYTADLIANVALGTKTDCFNYPDSYYSRCRNYGFLLFTKTYGGVGNSVFYAGTSRYNRFPHTLRLVVHSQNVLGGCGVAGDQLQLKNGKQDPLYKFEGDNLLFQTGSFFTGLESSSIATAFTLMELAKNKECQHRARREVREAVGKHGWTVKAFEEMKYLTQCLSESLRLHPAVSTLDRYTLSDYQIPNTDLVIEKGTPVFVSMYGLHGDAQYFEDPEVFRPERFDNDRMVSDAYMPFGIGPRMCVGVQVGLLHVKVVLSMILLEFEVHQNSSDVKLDSRSTFTAAADGINLEFTKLAS